VHEVPAPISDDAWDAWSDVPVATSWPGFDAHDGKTVAYIRGEPSRVELRRQDGDVDSASYEPARELVRVDLGTADVRQETRGHHQNPKWSFRRTIWRVARHIYHLARRGHSAR